MHPRLLGTTILTRNAPDAPAGGSPSPAPATPAAAPAAPSGGTPAPATPDPAAPAADPAAATPLAAPDPAAAPAAVSPKKDWKDDRIGELTAKYNDTKRQLDALKAGTPAAPAPTPAAGESQADFEVRVATEAARIAAATDWAKQCNDVAAAGRAAFPDFDSRLGAIKATVNGQDEAELAAYNSVLETAIETGKGHQLLYELGANPGEVRRLMGLSPTKRAMELATKAASLGAKSAAPDPSQAPQPITPIGSHGLHYEGIKPDDPVNGTKLPIADWMAQREKQANERGLQ